MFFEWDTELESANAEKYGVDFSIASRIFADDNRKEFADTNFVPGEGELPRTIVLGRVGDAVLVVCIEKADATRFVAARIATADEEEVYRYGNS